MGCVYSVTNKINGKKYIGKTIRSMEYRKRKHENRASLGAMEAFRCALRKYGFDNFEWIVEFESGNEEILIKIEIELIKEFNTKAPNGYNLTDGGDGLVGITEETRRKMSRTRKGRKLTPKQNEFRILKLREAKAKNPMTLETKEKIRKANTGKIVSEETRAKISAANKGKKRSEETKKKISEAGKGRDLGKSFEERFGEERSKEIKEKIRNKLKGRKQEKPRRNYGPLSDEHKIKISEALKGKKKPVFTLEHCENISKAQKGIKCSEETKAKMRESHRLRLLKKGSDNGTNC